jgi:kynureninase
VPPECTLRPVLTGWFSEFAELAAPKGDGSVPYGRGAARFAGSTYDPTAHYRAAAGFAFHQEQGLTAERLRTISRHQVGLLTEAFSALDLNPEVAAAVDLPADRRAGFLAIRTPHAAHVVARLRARDMLADARGTTLRLGPAPYLSDSQLTDAIALLGEIFKNPYFRTG